MIIKMSENVYYTHPRLSVGFSRLVKDDPRDVQEKPAFGFVIYFFSNYRCDLTSVKPLYVQYKKI